MTTATDVERFATRPDREKPELIRKRAAFVARHGLAERKITKASTSGLFLSGGASGDEVHALRERFPSCLHYSACGGPFDHPELFGRADDGAMALVGHPYGLQLADHDLLESLRRLGLHTEFSGPESSWYGHGTAQVVVSTPGLIRYREPKERLAEKRDPLKPRKRGQRFDDDPHPLRHVALAAFAADPVQDAAKLAGRMSGWSRHGNHYRKLAVDMLDDLLDAGMTHLDESGWHYLCNPGEDAR